VHPDRYLFLGPVLRGEADRRASPVPPRLPEHRHQRLPGPPNLSIGPIAPNGPNSTARYLDYFFAPDVEEDWRQEFFAFDNQVGREDTKLVESVHRGMASGVLEHGRLLLASEPLLAAFQRWVERRLTAD
jgi:Ring hydroxylating alpha subunit (catalytic domain)